MYQFSQSTTIGDVLRVKGPSIAYQFKVTDYNGSKRLIYVYGDDRWDAFKRAIAMEPDARQIEQARS